MGSSKIKHHNTTTHVNAFAFLLTLASVSSSRSPANSMSSFRFPVLSFNDDVFLFCLPASNIILASASFLALSSS
jgi:hypothetical protein